MLITNDTATARAAEAAGVDWIFVDLEQHGKDERQGHLDTVISRHTIQDVKNIRNAVSDSKLLVRINPPHDGTLEEVDAAISAGADILMLPFFQDRNQVAEFVGAVNNRAKTCLLLETPSAVSNLDQILEIPNIDYLHVGLNDLHLGLGQSFMFEPLASGLVDSICAKARHKGIDYGFGGISRLSTGALAAEQILAEHYRLGSSMVLLSRGFNAGVDVDSIGQHLRTEVLRLRQLEKNFSSMDINFFEKNREAVERSVHEIAISLQTSSATTTSP